MKLEATVLILFVFVLVSLFIVLSLTKNSRKKYMAKKPTISLINTGFSSTEQLNENFTALRDAFDNTLSLDGSTPNAMSVNFDLNSNDILNGGTINATDFVLDGQSIGSLAASAAEAESFSIASETSATNAAISETNAASSAAAAQAVEDQLPDWQGEWVTSTIYETGDLVRESGTVYICIEEHTSGTFSTDLVSSKWEVFAEKGAAGVGTGDMLAANNLSDVASVPSSRANPGLGTAAVEADTKYAHRSSNLSDLASVSTARTNLGLGTASTRDAEDTLTDGANLPDGAAVKAYMDAALQVKAWVTLNGTGTVAILDSD